MLFPYAVKFTYKEPVYKEQPTITYLLQFPILHHFFIYVKNTNPDIKNNGLLSTDFLVQMYKKCPFITSCIHCSGCNVTMHEMMLLISINITRNKTMCFNLRLCTYLKVKVTIRDFLSIFLSKRLSFVRRVSNVKN